ncbi:hypothetical protein D1007_54037 [Hordeum vulgare]|nr:hypothetical protein D1007_54037 [Hordeum vulgare]
MCLKDANPRLEEPKGLPEKTFACSSAKLSDPQVVPVLERFSRDISAKRLTGGILLGGDLGEHPDALGSLYRRDDRTNLVGTMPVFNERGLLPVVGSGPVEVSSGDTSGEGSSEKTVNDRTMSVPLPSQSVLLRELKDDGANDDTSNGTPLRPARASTGLVPTLRHTVCMRGRFPKARG